MRNTISNAETTSGQATPRTKAFLYTASPFACLTIHLFLLLASIILFSASPLLASDTMLMFVGENLEVLSLASRREEAAWSAPAIVDVITRQDIDNAGETTMANLLGKSAGFYINKREGGSVPYLRGIPDSALFLYDTVPMGSAADKSHHNIDNETSLAAIKRVEIVRGAGSVLWGPDAFAGVVNAVPFTGRDFQGLETGAGISSGEDTQWAYLNFGKNQGNWNAFLSLSAKNTREDHDTFNVINFWNDGKIPASPDDRWGEKSPENSHYYELYSSIIFNDWLTLSTRLSDNSNAYTVSNETEESVWEETLSTPSRTFKLEASKPTGINSNIRFTGYYSENDTSLEIIDKSFDSTERSLYGELIYDRSLFAGNGLLTTGTSWRQTTFKDILVWKSFFPAYLDPQNSWLLPLFETADYDNTLTSFFGQYRHKSTDLELWAGLRSDNHEQFKNKISYSLGLAWDFFPNFIFKAIYGTAYRTPSAEQVVDGTYSNLEQIDSVNAQFSWKSGTDKRASLEKRASLTFFRNAIDDHIIEDRYSGAGLSTPNSQTIYGAELEWDIQLIKRLSLSGNLTHLDNHGPDETYNYGRYFYEDSSGDVQEGFFQTLNYAYDAGADTMATLGLKWQLTKNITLMPEVQYIAETKLHYLHEADPSAPAQEITVTCPDVWLMNLHLKTGNLFPFSLDFFIENLWDKNYVTPGRYTLQSGQPFNAGVMIKIRW